MRRHTVGHMLQEKLLKQRAERAVSNAQQRIVEGNLEAVPIALRVVGAGDEAHAKIPQDVREVRLPVAVVALAYGDGTVPVIVAIATGADA